MIIYVLYHCLESHTSLPDGIFHLTDGYCNDLAVERRRNSSHLEHLFNFYMRMLCRHHQEMKLSKFWESMVKGLNIYPCSPNVYNALVEIGHLYVSPNKLRWIFDENFQKYGPLNFSPNSMSVVSQC